MNPDISKRAGRGYIGATSLRWSRVFTLAFIGALSAIIFVIIVTSELEGPGSAQLHVAAAAPTAAPTNSTTAASATTAAATTGQATASTTTVPATAGSAPVAPVTTSAPATVPAMAATTAAAPVQTCAMTESMPGGNNLYVKGAPIVENLGTGFVVSGVVLDADTCQPVPGVRIQIWLNTSRGGEGLPSNRGSVVTDENGRYRLETLPVVPQFGQPHVHIAYDDGVYKTLFLRPVLKSKDDPSITVDFVLKRNDIPSQVPAS